MENLLTAIHITFTSHKVRELRLSAIDRSEGAIFEGSTHQLKARRPPDAKAAAVLNTISMKTITMRFTAK